MELLSAAETPPRPRECARYPQSDVATASAWAMWDTTVPPRRHRQQRCSHSAYSATGSGWRHWTTERAILSGWWRHWKGDAGTVLSWDPCCKRLMEREGDGKRKIENWILYRQIRVQYFIRGNQSIKSKSKVNFWSWISWRSWSFACSDFSVWTGSWASLQLTLFCRVFLFAKTGV